MKKIYRQEDKVFAGICSGFAKYFEIDETIVRIIFTILLFTSFPMLTLYLVMWILIPKVPKNQ